MLFCLKKNAFTARLETPILFSPGNTLTQGAPTSGPSFTTALWFSRPSAYILFPEFSALLHTLQHVFHAATQQSCINALWHPIRENAS